MIIIPPSLIITGPYVLENCPAIAGAFESIPPSERTEKIDVQDILILWLMIQKAAGEASNFFDFLAQDLKFISEAAHGIFRFSFRGSLQLPPCVIKYRSKIKETLPKNFTIPLTFPPSLVSHF